MRNSHIFSCRIEYRIQLSKVFFSLFFVLFHKFFFVILSCYFWLWNKWKAYMNWRKKNPTLILCRFFFCFVLFPCRCFVSNYRHYHHPHNHHHRCFWMQFRLSWKKWWWWWQCGCEKEIEKRKWVFIFRKFFLFIGDGSNIWMKEWMNEWMDSLFGFEWESSLTRELKPVCFLCVCVCVYSVCCVCKIHIIKLNW